MSRRIYLLLLIAGLQSRKTHSQDTVHQQPITLQQLFQLVITGSEQIRIAQTNLSLAQQKKNVLKLYRLPGIDAGLTYGYISNADLWTPSFSEHQKGAIPHQYTQLSLTAAQLIFKGGEVNSELLKADLETQIAALALEKNSEDIRFLAAGYYLDIFRAQNQLKVYRNNEQLAERRLNNVVVMQRQGMVTENDVLRNKLILSDLQLAILKIGNNIAILNRQLNMLTGRPDSLQLVPDTTLLQQPAKEETIADWLETAHRKNTSIKMGELESRLAEVDIRRLRAESMPAIAAFAGSNLQRPFLNTIPSVDIFYNVWQAGINIKYNIASLYQTRRKIKAGQIALERSRQYENLDLQKVDLAVQTSYIKYREARDELQTLQYDLRSAEENYRITEKRYFNQLALLTELIDASNTKIEAELKVVGAQINIVFTHLQLLKAVGTL